MYPQAQPLFWIASASTINAIRYWFNGLPLPGVVVAARPAGSMKYWFNGTPCRVIKLS